MKELIKFFKVVPVSETSEMLDPIEVNNIASRLGYIVHPNACTTDVVEFLNSQHLNLDSTFYKTWESVTSKSRVELFVDQIIHYAMSYGLDETWVPEGECEIPEITSYKVILPCTEKEMYDRCMKMLQSGIALSTSTINPLVDYICEYFSTSDEKIDVDSIKNKEALIAVCDRLDLVPNDKFALLRYILYKTTEQTLMINDKETYYRLIYLFGDGDFNFKKLNEQQLRGLASIFFRYKYIFLGLRKRAVSRLSNKRYTEAREYDADNVKVINMLRRMANKYHKPMKIGYWENILNTPTAFPYTELREKVKEISNFKIVTLLQTILERQSIVGGLGPNLYIIRNGKVFVKESNATVVDKKYEYWSDLYEILYDQLVQNLSEKACNIKFPKYLELSCPTSEKNFVGNIPFGSSFDIKEKDSIFGIYWEGKDGCRDLDLSYCDYKGMKLGWNSNYYDEEQALIYSGDMTIADPCATELMYAKAGCSNGYINVNLYSGKEGGKYKFFYAQEKINSMKKNYMVNPNHIKFTTDMEAAGQQMVAVICDNRLYFMSFITGRAAVAQAGQKDDLDKIFKRKAKTTISLKQLLKDAGFKEVKKETEETPIDIDLTDLNKDTLIELFS